MRALILGLSVLAIVASVNTATAGLSSSPRQVASVDTAAAPDKPERQGRHRGSHARHGRGIGGPIGMIGGAIGGLLRR
jgi:hypothetical protein